MVDTDDKRKTTTGNPLVDLPVAPETPPGSGGFLAAYRIKRLRQGAVDASVLSRLLTDLETVEEEQRISLPFSSIFELSLGSQLIYTKKSAWEGADQNAHLFHSDLAMLFYDLLVSFDLIDTFSEKFEELTPNNAGSGGKLRELVNYCRNISYKTEISEDEERYLSDLLTNSNVHVIARFFLRFLEQEKEQPEEEEEKTDEKQPEDLAEGGGSEATDQDSTGSTSTSAEPGAETGGETAAEPGAAVSAEPGVTVPTTAQPVDVLELKRQLFSPRVREQAARFSQVALTQLEIFHGLPQGSLQNSRELRELLTQKSLGFFTNVLTEGRFDLLMSSPEERFRFIREFLWLTQNDFRTTAVITHYLSEVVIKNADPATKKQIEEALIKAEKGEETSKLIQDLAENPQVLQIIEAIKADSPSFQKNPQEYTDELTKELQQYLRDIGVQTDKVGLAQINTTNIIDALIAQGMPVDLLKYIDEKRFRMIFGEDIPYRPEFMEFLEDYWIARRATLGKMYGNLLLNTEARFATQEALKDVLDKNNTQGVSEDQSDEVFIYGVAEPLRDILVAHRDSNASIEDSLELAEALNAIEEWKAKQQAYLNSVWETLNREQQEEISHHFGYVVIPAEAPAEFTIHTAYVAQSLPYYTQGPLEDGGAYHSDYMPDNGQSFSPLAAVRGLRQRAHQYKNLSGFAKGIGKRFRGRFGKRAAKEAAKKAAEAGLDLAVSAVPGGQLLTKKGRRRTILLTLGGIGGLIVPIWSSWFTRLATMAGSIAGGLLFGPGGILPGALITGWSALGIQNYWNSLFGGGGVTPPTLPPANVTPGAALPGGEQVANAGGAGAAGGGGVPPTAAATTPGLGGTAAQIAMSTGTQAVLATIGVVAGTSIFSNMVLNNALLADFPQTPVAESFTVGGKASQYVTIEKRAFVTGCPENKCENPSFPVETEYAVVIKPKDNYSISIQDLTDTLRVGTSDKAWEEEGKTPPNIPERVKSMADFTEVYQGLTLNPGEEFAFAYDETFNEDYNHAIISNKLELKINFTDLTTGETGEDNAITGAAIYIGDYSQGEGCWPATGTITQLPGGSFSHSQVDAFDIGVGGQEGVPVYYPFSGRACAYTESTDDGGYSCVYGNHVILYSDRGEEFSFGHLRTMMIEPGTCDEEVEAGEIVGYIGNTSCNDYGVHLHFEVRPSSPGPWPTLLATLMPAGTGVSEGTPVESCYDQ